MGWEVYKSGGTSTGSAERYKDLADLVDGKTNTVLVVSAPAIGKNPDERVTELLQRAYDGENTANQIIDIYNQIAQPLELDFEEQSFRRKLSYRLRLSSPDATLSLGEFFQARLLSNYFKSKGIKLTMNEPKNNFISFIRSIENCISMPFQQTFVYSAVEKS